MAFLRASLAKRRAVTTSFVRDAGLCPHGAFARTAGVVLVRQRPSSAAGVIFITIEDETGSANIMIRSFDAPRFKRAIGGAIILCSGKIERVGSVVHILATDIEDISDQLRDLVATSRNFR
jgi:error-prone DNA polymerase